MADLSPKKISNDNSSKAKDKKNLREGTYSELNEKQKKYVDHFVDQRDTKGDELAEAESNIDTAIKAANKDKDISLPGEEPIVEIELDFGPSVDIDAQSEDSWGNVDISQD